LTFAAEAEAAKLAALNGTALIGSVNNPAQQQAAVNAVQDVKSILLAVERARKAIKEPLLEACRLIDARAAEFVAELKNEEIRVNTSLGNYQQEIIINARKEEAKRQEALRKIEEERQAEARRIAAEVADGIKDEAVAKAEAERQDALAKQAVEAVGPAAPLQKARGQVVKAVWTFEITDVWLLARTNPGLVRIDPNTSEIHQVIALGARDIKGMRIFEVVKSSTRQSGQTVINI
jgi:hypothetical protein